MISRIEKIDLYAPEDNKKRYYFLTKVQEFLDRYRPKKAIDYVVNISLGPTGYFLWKSPIKFHEIINKILKQITLLTATKSPEAALPLGLVDLISEVMLGIKKKDWKKTAAGLKGIHHVAKKIGQKGKNLEQLTHSALAEMLKS